MTSPLTDTELTAIEARAEAATQRIRDGHGAMRIPADPTDPDLVLADVPALVAEVRRLRGELEAASFRTAREIHAREWAERAEAAEKKCAELTAALEKAELFLPDTQCFPEHESTVAAVRAALKGPA